MIFGQKTEASPDHESAIVPPPVVNTNDVGLEYLLLDDIQFNETDNPRMSKNEVRDGLKNSIRSSSGMYVLLEVSRAPGDVKYSLMRGGNTRLDVLRELRDEWEASEQQQSNPYLKCRCLVYPWANDSEKAIMNATENMVRGGLSYAEEAKAVRILKNQFDVTETADVNFVDWVKACGLPMSLNKTAVGRYLHTADVLNPSLPILMIEGRANSTVCRWLMSVRTGLTRVLKLRIEGGTDSDDRRLQEGGSKLSSLQADTILTMVNTECDATTLDKDRYITILLERFAAEYSDMTDDERLIVGIGTDAGKAFSIAAGISANETFGDDDRKNASLIFQDIIEAGTYVGNKQKSRYMNKMGVPNDIGGCFKLIGYLNPKAKKALAKIMFS